MMPSPTTTRPRPLSPNVQIYRPQLTSVLSILNRITGIILSACAVVLVIWLVAAAWGPQTYAAGRGPSRPGSAGSCCRELRMHRVPVFEPQDPLIDTSGPSAKDTIQSGRRTYDCSGMRSALEIRNRSIINILSTIIRPLRCRHGPYRHEVANVIGADCSCCPF